MKRVLYSRSKRFIRPAASSMKSASEAVEVKCGQLCLPMDTKKPSYYVTFLFIHKYQHVGVPRRQLDQILPTH